MFKRIAGMFILIVAVPMLMLAHSGSHKKVMGTISKIEASKIHIRTKDGHDSHVPFTAKTAFLKNGKKVSLKDVTVGSRVVVDLTSKGAAEKITIGKTEKAPKH